jgi:CRISPR-associated endonuclease/helicase Cas3
VSEPESPQPHLVSEGALAPSSARLLRLWGKTGLTPDAFHPALYHMLDVGFVARSILGRDGSPRWRRVLGSALGTEPDGLVHWLPYLVALHDIGKVSASFQGQDEAQRDRLKTEGFDFLGWRPASRLHHSVVGHCFLSDALQDTGLAEFVPPFQEILCNMASAHHGRFLGAVALDDALLKMAAESSQWHGLRCETTALLRQALMPHALACQPRPSNVSAAVVALAGFSTLCDWLGSNGDYFSPAADTAFLAYLAESEVRARKAAGATGFLQTTLSAAPTAFGSLFSKIPAPRPLQTAIDAIPDHLLQGPSLTIMEAPTGEGKTEAALALAHRIGQARGFDDMYFALPTMATSNQMWKRLRVHFAEGLNMSGAVKLVHGQAFLLEDDLSATPLGGDEGESDDTLAWFAPKKRSLLAPFGVGTIDQAELGGLNVPFVTLRLLGLAGKVVIFDEVHAYDTYMTTVVERLLQWLAALGTSVIILSATLPTSRRRALARAFAGQDCALPDSDAYPSLWVVGRDGSHAVSPAASQPGRFLELHRLQCAHNDPGAKARWLLDEVESGGCACWIANTVRRAQDVYRELRRLASPDVQLDLFHSQFPMEDRAKLEERICQQYGPKLEGRPSRGIVVGTQVLEQSLDLDFDVMVTDLAPIDLLLQRAGRLHRHRRGRPPAQLAPRLWLNVPLGDDGAPALAGDSSVYDEFLLLLTWQVLAGRSHFELPGDYRPLVEAVYGAAEPAPDSALRSAWLKLAAKQADACAQARQRLLPAPDPDILFCADAAALQFQDDENGAGWIVAKTRLGEESLNVIPLERDGNYIMLGGDRVDLRRAPTRELQLRLLGRSLRLSNPTAMAAIRGSQVELPPLFARGPKLRGYLPVWLRDGVCRLIFNKREITLELAADLGFSVTTMKQGG